MRFGIFSDVHANLEAFKAVIEAYEKENIDAYFCLGDIIGYGASPIECINLVKKLGIHSIAGNHEYGVLGLVDIKNFTENAAKAIIWTADNIGQTELEFLKTLSLIFENDYLTLVHASLDDPDKFYYIYNCDDARHSFDLLKRQVCFIGHTHRPRIFSCNEDLILGLSENYLKIDQNFRYIVNVGSVGQPRDGDNRASFCIYDTDKNEIFIKRVEYNIKMAQEKILKTALPAIFAQRLG